MSLRLSRRLVTTEVAVLALCVAFATPQFASATGRPASALPTCDNLEGVTVDTGVRWRIFRPHPSTYFDDPGDLWACRRAPGPATQFTFIGGLARVDSFAGDLVQIANNGRYNAYTYALDLATGRFTTVAGDGSGRDLLGSGALVTIPPARAEGSAAYASFGADDMPGAGFYATGADGVLIREVPEPASVAATTADWRFPGPKTRFIKVAGPGAIAATHFEAARHPGVSVTPMLGHGYHLEARPGRRHRPATLEIRQPGAVAYGRDPGESDLIARLVPGSEREAHVADDDVIVGRFLDRPGELRARRLVASHEGRSPTYLFDLPAPDQANAVASTSSGDVAVASGGRIFIYTADRNSHYGLQTRTAPGARDLAMTLGSVTPSGPVASILYWTDAAGNPHREAIPRPG